MDAITPLATPTPTNDIQWLFAAVLIAMVWAWRIWLYRPVKQRDIDDHADIVRRLDKLEASVDKLHERMDDFLIRKGA